MLEGTTHGQPEEIVMKPPKKKLLGMIENTIVFICIVCLFIVTITPMVYSNIIKNGNLEYYTGKYYIQRAEITRGWVIFMDDGKRYYLSEDSTGDKPDTISYLYSNQNSSITISVLPPVISSHILTAYDGRIGSIYVDGLTLIDAQDQLHNLRVEYLIFLPFFIVVTLFLLLSFIIHILDIRASIQKRRRKKQKAEKIEQLRAEGKLHPTKQLQKKKKSN